MRPLSMAPTIAEALGETPEPEAASRVLSHVARPTDPYLPWEKLRFKTPPEGMTTLQWWAATKLGRAAMTREITLLRARNGSPFRYALPDEVLRKVDDVNRRASGTIGFDSLIPNRETRDRYIVSSLIEEAITSSQLEGASTTGQVARDMLRSGRVPKNRSEQMIVNNYQAMQHITELRDEKLTPDVVCEIHRIVTDQTLDDPASAGVVQQVGARRVQVVTPEGHILHTPPPAEELPERLERLCAFANGEDRAYLPAVLRSLAIHFIVGYDHYFEDGNGRTARALFYWSMLKEGYWLAEFLAISPLLKNAPARYARSFEYVETDEGDLTYFFSYHLGIITRAIDRLDDYLIAKQAAVRATRSRLGDLAPHFNPRQLALLGHALRHPGFEYTATSHAHSHRISVPTAHTDLNHLAESGLLTSGKQGRRHAWTSPADLDERINAMR